MVRTFPVGTLGLWLLPARPRDPGLEIAQDLPPLHTTEESTAIAVEAEPGLDPLTSHLPGQPFHGDWAAGMRPLREIKGQTLWLAGDAKEKAFPHFSDSETMGSGRRNNTVGDTRKVQVYLVRRVRYRCGVVEVRL